MTQKLFRLIAYLKSYATLSFSLHDMLELLHKPWQGHELALVLTMVLWTLLIKIPLFLLVNFRSSLPLIFSKRNSRFVLWLIYYTMAAISFTGLIGSYAGANPEMFVLKSITALAVLIWDWKETEEAVDRLHNTDGDERKNG